MARPLEYCCFSFVLFPKSIIYNTDKIIDNIQSISRDCAYITHSKGTQEEHIHVLFRLADNKHCSLSAIHRRVDFPKPLALNILQEEPVSDFNSTLLYMVHLDKNCRQIEDKEVIDKSLLRGNCNDLLESLIIKKRIGDKEIIRTIKNYIYNYDGYCSYYDLIDYVLDNDYLKQYRRYSMIFNSLMSEKNNYENTYWFEQRMKDRKEDI